MRHPAPTFVPFCAALLVLAAAPSASAQPGMGPTGPGSGGPGPAGPGGRTSKKKEGPAEEAPKDDAALRPIEPVPAEPEHRRQLQIFEVHGYLRMRGDYFHRLDLGLADTRPGSPDYTSDGFFRPPAETDEVDTTAPGTDTLRTNDVACIQRLQTQGVPASKIGNRCRRRNGFASANMRLRIAPTIHVTDTVKIHAQIDALDNLVLGSTPDSYGWDHPWAPIDLYTRTQTPPTSGINSFTDSIVVKRAWGQIHFGFGLDIAFGRMPRHWGLGIVYNDGNGYARNEAGDIVRMVDTDWGDSVDSLRLSYDIGKDRRRTHTLGFSWDWAASGPTTSQLLGPGWSSGGRVGQDFSVEKFDNVYQWTLFLERRDAPDMLRRKLAMDDVVFNYGLMGMVRYQDVSAPIGAPGFGDGLGTNASYFDDAPAPDPVGGGGATLGNGEVDGDGNDGVDNYASILVHRRAILATPDLWLRVNWRTLRVEFEAAGNFGRFYARDFVADADTLLAASGNEYFKNLSTSQLRRTLVTSFGYALEFKLGFFQDKFHIGFDHGFATGDTARNQDFNYQNPLLVGDNGRYDNFRFNPAYMQDLLLFREILGTVSNATYFKPWGAFYFFDKNFSVRADIMYAMAARPQSTLGNKYSYGIELDGAARYHDREEPIFFQIQYGVLFPLGAFNRLLSDGTREDARAAQTVQAQLGIRY